MTMNQHNPPATRAASAPTAVTSELSFCKTTARDLAAWLQRLPKANTGEYSRQLYLALSELSKLQAAPELRIQLLEQIRPEVVQITRQLEKNHLLSNVILSSRANKVANLCQTLQHLLTSGYKQVVADSQHKRSSLLALSVQRTLHGLFSSLALTYLTYRSVPPGLWFEAHQMHRLAAHHKLQTQKVNDPLLGSVPAQTLEQAYCCTLLLGCSRANQMRQRDIQTLVKVLPRWSTLAQLQPISQEGSLFAVAQTTDTPPRYTALLNLSGRSQVLGLNTRALSGAIMDALKARETGESQPGIIDEHIPVQLLQQLACAWGDIAKRGFPRNTSTDELQLCLGMSSVHYHLAGRKTFEDTLQQPPEESTLELSMPSGEETVDIWSTAVDAYHEASVHLGSIDYSPPGKEEAPQDTDKPDHDVLYSLHTAKVVNQSPGGYCLEWLTNAPPNLQTGDILALRKEENHDWAIATIRWIRQNNQTGARIGIEMLAHRAQPCGTRLLRSGKAASNYLRALCIPEIAALSRPAQLITAKIPFREGCTITLNIDGEESRATLGRLIQHTASYSQFEYAPVKATAQTGQGTGKTQPATADHVKVGNHDDFTSLWDLL